MRPYTLYEKRTKPSRYIYKVKNEQTGLYEAVDITGHTIVLKIGYPEGTLSKQAVITAAATGVFEVRWNGVVGETPADLRYNADAVSAQFLVTDNAGKEDTQEIPGGIKIKRRL